MITRKVPWRGVDSSQIIIAVAQKNTRLKIPKGCDPILRKIMKGVWKENPKQRMTMAQVLQTLTDYHNILAQYEVESDCDVATDSESESLFGASGERQARIQLSTNGHGKTAKPNSEEERLHVTSAYAVVGKVTRLRSSHLVQRRSSSDGFRVHSPITARRYRRRAAAEAQAIRAQVRSDSWEVYTCPLPSPSLSMSPPVFDSTDAVPREKECSRSSDEDEDEAVERGTPESAATSPEEDSGGGGGYVEVDVPTPVWPLSPRQRFDLDESVEVYTSIVLSAPAPAPKKRRRCSAGPLEQQPSFSDQ
jgi:hypothetical protein